MLQNKKSSLKNIIDSDVTTKLKEEKIERIRNSKK
jgi:hypothetical protein